ncbi:hypothetical protein CYMTET_52953 [Cymbomonas tetramitiformis]|uniref:Uncharacterized protein n=1 Tax=Cymbomonas tetramitiformis TaxID=36881 RepID=A0AAE0BJ36_9CHLO|nr:hypothetical protein CYMTET_52953 [Cymbomonas tetramitiformis]
MRRIASLEYMRKRGAVVRTNIQQEGFFRAYWPLFVFGWLACWVVGYFALFIEIPSPQSRHWRTFSISEDSEHSNAEAIQFVVIVVACSYVLLLLILLAAFKWETSLHQLLQQSLTITRVNSASPLVAQAHANRRMPRVTSEPLLCELHVPSKLAFESDVKMTLERDAPPEDPLNKLDVFASRSRRTNHEDQAKQLEQQNALFLAAAGDDINELRLLLRLETVKLSCRCPAGLTALGWAIKNGNTETAQALLDAGSDLDSATQENNWTGLHEAANQGDVQLVELLLKHGASVDARDTTRQETPLHRAALNKHKAAVEALIRGGANIFLEQEEGRTPLHIAILQDCARVVAALVLAGAANAFLCDQAPVRRRELRQAMPLQLVAQRQETPLQLAARLNRINAVEALIQYGVDVSVQNKEMQTPLHMAARCGHAGVVGLLLTSGADVNRWDQSPHTALHEAALHGHAAVVKALICGGADVDARAEQLVTPLHWAVFKGHREVAKLLIDAGASVNRANTVMFLRTPLHLAAMKGRVAVAQTLLEAGADITARDEFGFTALDTALSTSSAMDSEVKLQLQKMLDEEQCK